MSTLEQKEHGKKRHHHHGHHHRHSNGKTQVAEGPQPDTEEEQTKKKARMDGKMLLLRQKAAERLEQLTRESSEACVVNSGEQQVLPDATNQSKQPELDLASFELLRRRCQLIPQIVGNLGMQLVMDLRSDMDLGDVLRKNFPDTSDGAYNDWGMWRMPFIVPLTIPGRLEAADAPYVAHILSDQGIFSRQCNRCPVVPCVIANVDKTPEKVSKEPEKSLPKSPKKTEHSHIAVSTCQLPRLLLTAFYRACWEEVMHFEELIGHTHSYIARSARVYIPESPELGTEMPITSREEEYIRMELALKLLWSRAATWGWTGDEFLIRRILELMRCWSSGDGWQTLNKVAEFGAFAVANVEMLNCVDIVCKAVDAYKNGKLMHVGIFECLYNLQRSIQETVELKPKKRLRATRVNVYPCEKITVQATYDELARNGCFAGALKMYRIAQHFAVRKSAMAVYKLPTTAAEDVASAVARSGVVAGAYQWRLAEGTKTAPGGW